LVRDGTVDITSPPDTHADFIMSRQLALLLTHSQIHDHHPLTNGGRIYNVWKFLCSTQ